MPKTAKHPRTTHGLRDILFDEIDRMRGPDADPTRALAVANLSKQIINTAKVEMDFLRASAELQNAGRDSALGTLALGSS